MPQQSLKSDLHITFGIYCAISELGEDISAITQDDNAYRPYQFPASYSQTQCPSSRTLPLGLVVDGVQHDSTITIAPLYFSLNKTQQAPFCVRSVYFLFDGNHSYQLQTQIPPLFSSNYNYIN